SYPAPNAGWITEIALDVEWAHAMAPEANILLVEAASNSLGDLLTAVDYARHASGVVAISMSWGTGEFLGASLVDGFVTTPVGHEGVTFVASTGDSGAPSGYPAYSPNVVAVGGTTLTIDNAGNWLGEAAWSGSGGGISALESQPVWQNGIATQSSTQRTAPDVAYDANPSSGVTVYDSYNNGSAAPPAKMGAPPPTAPPRPPLIPPPH